MEHASVSAVHAQFSIQGGGVELTDQSANGTFVNGIRIKSAVLHDGDYITFGRYSGKSLIFRSGLEPQLKMENIDLEQRPSGHRARPELRRGDRPSHRFEKTCRDHQAKWQERCLSIWARSTEPL